MISKKYKSVDEQVKHEILFAFKNIVEYSKYFIDDKDFEKETIQHTFLRAEGVLSNIQDCIRNMPRVQSIKEGK